MLLSDEEKEGKLGVLGDISQMLAHKDAELIGAKRKKPAVIAAEVTKIEPKEGDLGSLMSEAGHDGVEAEEARLFPEEEAEEDRKMGDSMELAAQGAEPSPEEKAMIKELYHRYFG